MLCSIQTFFSTLFAGNSFFATIIISIIPVVELKGAIPFGMSIQFWGENALSNFAAFGASVIGLSLLTLVLAAAYRPLINFLKRTKLLKKLGEKIDSRIQQKKQKVDKKIELSAQDSQIQLPTQQQKNDANSQNKVVATSGREKFAKILSVFLFVALPLPLTGVWTGTCLAVALNLNYFETCLTVIVANAIAGLLILLISSLFGSSTHILLYILFVTILLSMFFVLFKNIIKKRRVEPNQNTQKS